MAGSGSSDRGGGRRPVPMLRREERVGGSGDGGSKRQCTSGLQSAPPMMYLPMDNAPQAPSFMAHLTSLHSSQPLPFTGPYTQPQVGFMLPQMGPLSIRASTSTSSQPHMAPPSIRASTSTGPHGGYTRAQLAQMTGLREETFNGTHSGSCSMPQYGTTHSSPQHTSTGAGGSSQRGGSESVPVQPVQLDQHGFMSADELYEAALAQPVIYYRPVPSTGASQESTRVIENEDEDDVEGGETTTVQDDREYELDEELAILGTLDPKCTGYKGSGKWQNLAQQQASVEREVESSKPQLMIAFDGSFIDGASATITNVLKHVMRKAHTGYPDFSKDERDNGWNMFQRCYRWDKKHYLTVEATYHKTAQANFSRMITNCKKFWLAYRKDQSHSDNHKTWATAEWLESYIKYWNTKKSKDRAKSSKENQAKRE